MDTDDSRRATFVEQEVLAPHAGVRHRVVDDHMFAPDLAGFGYSRCRLQVFSGPGLRTVAVAVQVPSGDGGSLVNLAERYAQTTWRRFCPDEPEPPIWIQHQIDTGPSRSLLVQFTVTDAATLTTPRSGPGIRADELARLIGNPIDLSRGNQVLRVLEPEPVLRLEPATVLLLPHPDAEADRACRPAGITWTRVLRRQLFPVRHGADCCWYHGGNWHDVSAMALAGLRHARAAGHLDEDDVAHAVLNYAKQAGWTGWPMDALHTLILQPILIEDGCISNGRHRTQCLLEAGVRRTVVGRFHLQR